MTTNRALANSERKGEFRNALAGYPQPHLLVVDEVGYLNYGPDAANVLFHVVNNRHTQRKPMIFTTNKSPCTEWGDVLHDHDLADAIVDRILDRERHIVMDGPSYRTRHLQLDSDANARSHEPARNSGTCMRRHGANARYSSGSPVASGCVLLGCIRTYVEWNYSA